MEPAPNTIRVKLMKRRGNGLGILVKERTFKPRVVISDLIAGGVAEESGLIQVGDMILRVNDIDISGIAYKNAVEMLDAIPFGVPVVFLLKGPEGFTTHLETTFQEDGFPRTLRVTKPIRSGSRSRSNSPAGRVLSYVPLAPSPLASPQNMRKMNQENGGVPKEPKKAWENNEENKSQTMCSVDPTVRGNSATDMNGDTVGCPVPHSPQRIERDNNSTILEMGNSGSPKIVLHGSNENKTINGSTTTTTMKQNGIEIAQNDEEIVVTFDQSNGHIDTNSNKTKISRTQSMSPERRSSKCNGHEPRKITNSPNKGDRKPSTSPSKKFQKLKYLEDENTVYTDCLYGKAIEPTGCSGDRCMGSILATPVKRPPDHPRPKEELLQHAKDFIDQYYASIKRSNTLGHQKRWTNVSDSIENTGTYELTSSELTFGAKTAWRNAPRCIGRIQWSKLQVFDARHIRTARGMFEACCNHIKYGTNKGNIRSAITIFPPRTDGKHDFRIWNPQLIRYAGYKQPDGKCIGDPANIEITEICEKMGWKGKGGRFDVLPLVLQAYGQDPELFEIPPELVLEVHMKHDKYPWFADMGLKWYALPAVSSMMLDCGGLEFTAAPFNGWYMGTEIGARDFCDKSRYNLLNEIAEKMGFDTTKTTSLWKDRVMLEMNISVLQSFQNAKTTITDHHTASESFMKHMEHEQKLRGGCPADWVWIVPPMSGSLTPVFHQEMLKYFLRPSYEYLDNPWTTYVWKKDREKKESKDKSNTSSMPKRKFTFREIARAVKFSAKLMGKALARRIKCTILYATETGKSETYAKSLCELFKHAFDAKILCMDEYDIIELEHEALVLFVTSTFGNGDPPENGERMAKLLHEMLHPSKIGIENVSFVHANASPMKSSRRPPLENGYDSQTSIDEVTGPLSNVRYSVFGLGSSAYPHFCAFGKYLERTMSDLGGESIHAMGEGDELCGQERSYNEWAKKVFKAACETFCVGEDIDMSNVSKSFAETDLTWAPGKYRLTPIEGKVKKDICKGLSDIHHKQVYPCKLISIKNLQSKESKRETILVKLDTAGYADELNYEPGDHVGIFPANQPELVESILSKLHNSPPPDQLIRLELLKEKSTPLGLMKSWLEDDRFPIMTLREAFTRYLDITTPPTPGLLHQLAQLATKESEKDALEELAKDHALYEDWKHFKNPNILEVLEEFPSLKIGPTLFLSQLPVLKHRFYSISSSSKKCPGEVHCTVAVVTFQTEDGKGAVHHGVCSSYLNRLKEGEVVPCFVRGAPAFRMAEDKTLPIIMVGPGTGIAPFRSFWQHRKVDMVMSPIPSNEKKTGWGDMILYFGCRRAKEDDIYEHETSQATEKGVLKGVFTALSREPGIPKTYVQDILERNSKDIYRQIVTEGGHFYVCGDVSMASNVKTTLEKIIHIEGNMDKIMAHKYVIAMRDANRFHEDIFGITLRTSEVQNLHRDQAIDAQKLSSSKMIQQIQNAVTKSSFG